MLFKRIIWQNGNDFPCIFLRILLHYVPQIICIFNNFLIMNVVNEGAGPSYYWSQGIQREPRSFNAYKSCLFRRQHLTETMKDFLSILINLQYGQVYNDKLA